MSSPVTLMFCSACCAGHQFQQDLHRQPAHFVLGLPDRGERRVHVEASGRSSKPASEISPGTLSPRARIAFSAPDGGHVVVAEDGSRQFVCFRAGFRAAFRPAFGFAVPMYDQIGPERQSASSRAARYPLKRSNPSCIRSGRRYTRSGGVPVR